MLPKSTETGGRLDAVRLSQQGAVQHAREGVGAARHHGRPAACEQVRRLGVVPREHAHPAAAISNERRKERQDRACEI